MDIVLNRIFNKDIVDHIIQLAKQQYKNDRANLYNLMYSQSLVPRKRVYNYNNIFKFKDCIDFNSLTYEIALLKHAGQLDYNTIEKVMCCLAFCEYSAYQDYMYNEHDYYCDIQLMSTIVRLYNLMGVTQSNFPDYVRLHQLSIINGENSPFYK
tara:strand:+ start:134 stop:595 length:462 start_codon:yes stop_codon:yes gene_type:complete